MSDQHSDTGPTYPDPGEVEAWNDNLKGQLLETSWTGLHFQFPQRGHFEKHGWYTVIVGPDQFPDGGDTLQAYVDAQNMDLVLGIHAYKAGRLLAGLKVPYILVLGGTDINIDSDNCDKMAVMTQAVMNAGHIIGFGESLMNRFLELWPEYDSRMTSVIPQAVKVEPSNFSITEYIKQQDLLKDGSSPNGYQTSHDHELGSHDRVERSHDQHVTRDKVKLFIFAGGIRPVKDPLFLVKEFSGWRTLKKREDCVMLFVGPEMDQAYFEEFTSTISELPGVIHIPRLEPQDTHAAIRDSFALINSSDSEGMSLSILEAMCLGTPVVARDIPGNKALVTDGSTGLLYTTGEEFLEKIELLLGNHTLVEKITKNARDYISQHHSVEMEEKAYIAAVNSLQRNYGPV